MLTLAPRGSIQARTFRSCVCSIISRLSTRLTRLVLRWHGSSPHTDWHLMTIILQDTTGGLLCASQPSQPYPLRAISISSAPGVSRGAAIRLGGRACAAAGVIVGDYPSALSDGKSLASHPRPHCRLDPTMRAHNSPLTCTGRIPKPGKLVSPARVRSRDPAQRYSLTFSGTRTALRRYLRRTQGALSALQSRATAQTPPGRARGIHHSLRLHQTATVRAALASLRHPP